MGDLKNGKKAKRFFIRDYLFFVIFGVALIFSLALTVPLVAIFGEMNQRALDRVVFEAEKGIQTEAEYLLNQSREMDETRVFDRLLSEKDSAGLIAVSTEEARRRDIGGILVADETGQVLSRTRAVSQRGDFVFHSTFWGRESIEKGESSGIERGATHPVIIYGAKKLEREGSLLGLIVSAQVLDDDYASVFSDKYLPEGTKIAFLAKEKGLIGSNFGSLEEKRLLEIYFSPGSEFNEKYGAETKIALNGGKYFAENIIFEGGYDSFGNMIAFVPNDYNRQAVALSLVLVLFFVLASLIAVHLDKHSHNKAVLLFLIVSGAGLVFAFSYFFTLSVSDRIHIRLSEPPYLIYNSTLEIDPDSATINRDFEHIASVDVLTGGESINAVEAELNYDPLLAKVVEIKTNNSFCGQNFFIEREIDNEAGVARVVCGLPTPGFKELKGTAFELVFQPLKTGKLTFEFGKNTKVLANDGLGTNVLRQTTGASFLIAEGGASGMDYSPDVLIFSPSHPNTTRWYNRRNPTFTWSGLDSYEYSYAFDQNPDTEPDENVLTTETSASFEAKEDGIYYFHLLSKDKDGKSWVSRYPIKIDSTPPDAPTIKASADEVLAGEVTRLEFSSKDEQSGLQPTFYVKLRDDGVFFPTAPQLFIAFPEKGEQSITVRVFDFAGNHSESRKTIKVR